ncbi:MAG: glycosyltransferase [Patescibacteria group bacterium]
MNLKAKNPKVSVVVAVYNREAEIERFLKSVKNQSYENLEAVVVDDGSTDNTVAVSRKYTSKVFARKHTERSLQRNFGVKFSTGKYVLVLDSDMILTTNVVRDCVRIAQSNGFKALIVPERSIGEGYWAKVKAFERSFYVGDETIEAARFFDKETFLKFGGYDTTLTGPEDWDLPLRMRKFGLKIGRIGSYILHDEGKLSLIKTLKKKFYYGRHAHGYAKRHPEMISSQGNLFFRPAFIRGWRRLLENLTLTLGLIIMRGFEMLAAATGFLYGLFN